MYVLLVSAMEPDLTALFLGKKDPSLNETLVPLRPRHLPWVMVVGSLRIEYVLLTVKGSWGLHLEVPSPP